MTEHDRHVPAQYGACRTWQHAWDPTTVTRKAGEYHQGLRCMRCGTERTVRVDGRSGDRVGGNRYLYPEGYLLKGGGGPLSARERAEVRLAEVKGNLSARDELARRRRRSR